MDLLRGGAVVLVVIFHAATAPGVPDTLHVFNDAVGSLRLGALFLASGLLLDRSLAKGTRRYAEGKARRIVWPYLLWSGLVMLPLLGWSRGQDLAWWLFPRGSHTWFLSALAAIYVIAWLTRRIPPGWTALGLLVVSQLVDRGASDVMPFVHEVSWWGTFFMLGAVLARHADAVLDAPVWVFSIGAGLTLLWSTLNVLPVSTPGKTPLSALMTAIGIGTVVWVLHRLPGVWPVTLIERLGQRSIVTYLVHLPVLKILVVHLGWPFRGWLGYLSLVAVVLLVCIVATRHYARIRWLFEWPLPAGPGRSASRVRPVRGADVPAPSYLRVSPGVVAQGEDVAPPR